MISFWPIRVGHVVLIVFALIVMWWNIAHNGSVWLTLLNVAIVAVNLTMLWWWRNV
jgi:hypothetical protein